MNLAIVIGVFRNLLRDPNIHTMQVLADALEEVGAVDLAHAYRWAAKNDKWPFRRHDRHPSIRKVWDWDRMDRDLTTINIYIPKFACLPRVLYNHIRIAQPNRKYGGINRAFILLANALKGTK